MNNSYIFFETDLRDRFLDELAALGLRGRTHNDAMEGFVIEFDTDDENLLDRAEDAYEALMQEQMLRADDHPEWGSHQVASLRVTLPDGSDAEVRLPAAVARTLLERYSVDEAHELVSAIAHSLTHPEQGPLCRKDLLAPDT